MDGESALTLPPGVWLDTVDSTMDEAKRRLAQGAFEGTGFVVADHQTAGRGTRGRVWVSPAEGLFLSLVLQATVDDPLALTSAYTQAAGVACVEALQLATGVQPVLKPINDVMLHTPQGVKNWGHPGRSRCEGRPVPVGHYRGRPQLAAPRLRGARRQHTGGA
ncbi:MAG: hypothetical protein R2857_09990 [Vampirovibrionales bacterium]